MLPVMSTVLRKRGLGLVATGVVIAVLVGGQGGSALDFAMGTAWASLYLRSKANLASSLPLASWSRRPFLTSLHRWNSLAGTLAAP